MPLMPRPTPACPAPEDEDAPALGWDSETQTYGGACLEGKAVHAAVHAIAGSASKDVVVEGVDDKGGEGHPEQGVADRSEAGPAGILTLPSEQGGPGAERHRRDDHPPVAHSEKEESDDRRQQGGGVQPVERGRLVGAHRGWLTCRIGTAGL